MIAFVISPLVGGLVGTIAFVILKQIVDSQNTSGWSGADRAIITIIPTVLGVIVMVSMFMALSKQGGT